MTSDPILDTMLGTQAGGSPTTQPKPFVPHFPHVFDSSIIATLKSCEKKFFNEYIQHWKPKDQSVHLHAGASFAKGLEVARDAFYTGHAQHFINTKDTRDGTEHKEWIRQPLPQLLGDAETSIALGLQALLESYGAFECPEDSAKSASRMAGAYEFYFSNYPLRLDEEAPITLPGGKRGIEFSFAHPIELPEGGFLLHPETKDPLLYVGRMDMLMNFAGGIFLEDDKTTSQLGPTWSRQWDLRSQFTGYAWGCQKSGIHVDGAVVRGVSILKTKYDTQQAVSYRPEWQIDRWYSELILWIQRAINAYKSGIYLHNLDHSCAEYGGCSFRQACSSEDEAPWLDINFERREWNPLTREEKKL